MSRMVSVLTIGILFIAWGLAAPAPAAERPARLKLKDPVSAPAPAPVVQVTILSIIPAQAEPGGKVTVFGSGFGERIGAFLGTVEITARVVDGKQVEFVIPQNLEPGLYAFYLRRSDGVTGKTYNFSVLPLHPVLSSLSPDQVSTCALGREREVTAQGLNFNEHSLLLFDGAVIKSSFVSSEAITFTVPMVAGGQHQVVVRNQPDISSVPQALMLDSRPEIGQVSVGDDRVSYYELIITGKNFQQNSSIYVDGQRIGGRGGQELGEREKLIYIDCTRLIYQRHPYSPATKELHIQVLNPGGEGSQVVTVNVP